MGKIAQHLTPQLLKEELTSFRELKGYLPRVLLGHLSPMLEAEIKSEVDEVARSLNASLTLAHEGMEFELYFKLPKLKRIGFQLSVFSYQKNL